MFVDTAYNTFIRGAVARRWWSLQRLRRASYTCIRSVGDAAGCVGVRTAVESELPVRDCGTGGAGSIRLFFGPTRALFGGESGSTSSSDSQFRARFCRETFFSVSDNAVSRSDVSSVIFAF